MDEFKNNQEYLDRGEDGNGQEKNRLSSEEYLQFRSGYSRFAKKETLIQVIGGIFIILTLLIEILVFRMAKRLSILVDLPLLQRFSAMFVFLFLITAMATLQFVIMFKWNQAVKNQDTTLTSLNYRITGQIRIIQIISLIIILLGVIFIRLSVPLLRIHPQNTVFPRMAFLYRFLLRISDGLLLMFMAGEFIQLSRWIKRIRSLHRVETTILQDFPDLDQILALESAESDADTTSENQKKSGDGKSPQMSPLRKLKRQIPPQ